MAEYYSASALTMICQVGFKTTTMLPVADKSSNNLSLETEFNSDKTDELTAS